MRFSLDSGFVRFNIDGFEFRYDSTFEGPYNCPLNSMDLTYFSSNGLSRLHDLGVGRYRKPFSTINFVFDCCIFCKRVSITSTNLLRCVERSLLT